MELKSRCKKIESERLLSKTGVILSENILWQASINFRFDDNVSLLPNRNSDSDRNIESCSGEEEETTFSEGSSSSSESDDDCEIIDIDDTVEQIRRAKYKDDCSSDSSSSFSDISDCEVDDDVIDEEFEILDKKDVEMLLKANNESVISILESSSI